MHKRQRTKIIATLGPATTNPSIFEELVKSGLNCVRLNFSHGTHKDHINAINLVRKVSSSLDVEIGIIADLQGPKVRIKGFKNDSITLENEQSFILDTNLDEHEGDETKVGVDYNDLPKDVSHDSILLLNDGKISLRVTDVTGSAIHTTVITGGALSAHKGINLKGGGLSAETLTKKDLEDIEIIAPLGVDYFALSFVKNGGDIHHARELIQGHKSNAGIIAKIERKEAVDNIDEIIKASNVIMVARGDLAVEIGDAEVPWVQKMIINKCRSADKAVITATQMMESMISESTPTRAEVSDVANAVLDGTDCVMLSAETATGRYPVEVIKTVVRICQNAEAHPATNISKHRLECTFDRVDETIAMAAMYIANHFNIRAIITLTESGSTPLWMSRIRSGIPIYGLSRNIETLRKTTLYRGVFPIFFDPTVVAHDKLKQKAINELVTRQLVQKDDYVIFTKGDHIGEVGHTNDLKILKVR